jgi:hypothetical protein
MEGAPARSVRGVRKVKQWARRLLARWLFDMPITSIRVEVPEGSDQVESIILTRSDGRVAVVPCPRSCGTDWRVNVRWVQP